MDVHPFMHAHLTQPFFQSVERGRIEGEGDVLIPMCTVVLQCSSTDCTAHLYIMPSLTALYRVF